MAEATGLQGANQASWPLLDRDYRYRIAVHPRGTETACYYITKSAAESLAPDAYDEGRELTGRCTFLVP